MKIRSAPELYRLIFIWLFIVILWSLYRITFTGPEWAEEIFIKPVVFVLPVIIFVKMVHKKLDLESLGLHIQNWEKVIAWGVIVGLLLSLELIIISIVKGKVVNTQIFIPELYIAGLVVAGATAFWEEILYRGFFLNRLQKIFSNLNTANIISATGFSVAHLPIAVGVLHYQNLELAVYLILVLILGLINGLMFQKTGNIFASVIAHTMWNFTVGFF